MAKKPTTRETLQFLAGKYGAKAVDAVKAEMESAPVKDVASMLRRVSDYVDESAPADAWRTLTQRFVGSGTQNVKPTSLSVKPATSTLSVKLGDIPEPQRKPARAPAGTTPPPAAKKPRPAKYQPVEPVLARDPRLLGVEFPKGAGLGGPFAIEKGIPFVGRVPFSASRPSGYSGLAGGVPANRVFANVEEFTDLAPEKVLTPSEFAERFKGGIPLLGDRLRAGRILGVNDRPQVGVVEAHGGPDFPRLAAEHNEAWKSGKSVVSGINKMALRAEELLGGPVAGVYSAMSAPSLDQTTAMIELIGRQIAAGGVTRAKALEMDDLIRKTLRMPDFIGFAKDPIAAAAQLNVIEKVSIPARSAVTKLINKAPALRAGFPDIGANRAALTQPELLYAPEGTSGTMFSALTPPRGRGGVAEGYPHPNYPLGVLGSYEGRLAAGVPRELLFPRYFNAFQGSGRDPGQVHAYLFANKVPQGISKEQGSTPLIQPFDQQWVDTTSKYLEDIAKFGPEPYAAGGRVADLAAKYNVK